METGSVRRQQDLPHQPDTHTLLSTAKTNCCKVFVGLLKKLSFTEVLKGDNANKKRTVFWVIMLYQKFFLTQQAGTAKPLLKSSTLRCAVRTNLSSNTLFYLLPIQFASCI